MDANYAAIILLFITAVGFAGSMIVLSALIGKKTYESSKLDTFECGLPYQGEARLRFSVKFYIVAMLFTLFDIEAVFFFPWAVFFHESLFKLNKPGFAFIEMFVFILILIIPYIYAWKKGVFEWK
ncbi:MAG: hypothetical protein A2161_11485 [Candidatus Schekmanbacteria bacterium RBG_13_48_7]|uniref:NADH-quinone oxidoreductase subunit A n=1 Tax=Candidatus Schekmanbacteria bacterium RBG_13_48_7 TaxID=1817878 RepID=A0A1F7RWJ1_9BACT|nr:MAG: hypothetical protein A2161_11485 [Candidatus Schekmanbacteria bacterium RBG_13_48_7]